MLDLSLSELNAFSINIPVFEGSVIAQNHTLMIHTNSVNPFNGTACLNCVSSVGFWMDGEVNLDNPYFAFSAGGNLNIAGTTIASDTVTITPVGLTLTGNIDINASASWESFSASGEIDLTASIWILADGVIGFGVSGDIGASVTLGSIQIVSLYLPIDISQNVNLVQLVRFGFRLHLLRGCGPELLQRIPVIVLDAQTSPRESDGARRPPGPRRA